MFILDSLLVGAPKAISDFSGTRTGALYRCHLNSRTDDCQNLYVDPDNSSCKFTTS